MECGTLAKCTSSQERKVWDEESSDWALFPNSAHHFASRAQACECILPTRAQVWSAEVLEQERVVPRSISVMCGWLCFFVPSDVRPGYCYTALANGRCSNQLPQSITKMQCCCDLGRCWSPGVTVAPEMCPIRATGKSPSLICRVSPVLPPQAQWHAWCRSSGNPGKWKRCQ